MNFTLSMRERRQVKEGTLVVVGQFKGQHGGRSGLLCALPQRSYPPERLSCGSVLI